MNDPAVVQVYDALTKWFQEHDVDLETELGWRAVEKRLQRARLVFEPGDRDAYGDFDYVSGPTTTGHPTNLGQFWTALTIYVQAPAPVDSERDQIVYTTRLLHAVLVALQQTVSHANFRVVSTRWLLLDAQRRANAAIALTISVRDTIETDVSDFLSFDADGRLTLKARYVAAIQPVPAEP
jgi:hypothetical protein